MNRRGLENVILREYVPKELSPSVMMAAGCALITLRDEALGVMSPSKLHSNLAMGLPVLYVGPERSNVDEAIRRFGCGVSVRHGDASAVESFIRRLASDPAARQEMRDRARRAFEEAYCDVRTLPQFDRVIEAVAMK
jgi:glycosyltransferase involved in cell wall biosynthesis